MFIALFIIAISLKFIDNGDKSGTDKNNLPKIWEAWYVLAFTLLFDNAYAWSWGPLGALLQTAARHSVQKSPSGHHTVSMAPAIAKVMDTSCLA